jgi:hypothetical protein
MPDNEFQRKLHDDPRFEELIREINFPKDDKPHLHATASLERNPVTHAVTGWKVYANVNGTW